MYTKFFTCFTLLCLSNITWIFAQEHHDHTHELNELGLSGGGIYSPDHESWGGGVHLHYFRTLGLHSKWALGATFEQVWAEGNHFTIGAGVKYMITDRLNCAVMPGISFMKHEESVLRDGHEHTHADKKTIFSLHTEIVYDLIHKDNFHIGPAIDYSWSKDDSHIMVGIHAAYCF